MTGALLGDQRAAKERIDAFLTDPRPRLPYLILHGLAGTGKTHVLSIVAHERPGSTMCAFTGKAASVLRARTGLDVSTVHSAIYDFKGIREDEEGRKRPVFDNKEDAGLNNRLVLLDECSTCGERLAEDLLSTGARVIAVGDPGQLPPVMDRQFFVDPDVTLSEVHRQAWDSPIIRQAHRIRGEGRYSADGDAFRVVERATEDDLLNADVALCWRNATRRLLNNRMREVRGIGGTTIRTGEPIMCLKNDYRLRMFNGAVYETARPRSPGDDLAVVTENGTVTALNAVVEGFDDGFDALRNEEGYSPFALAYGATIHKAQGSEWANVMVVDECNRADDRRALLYTGVTRASENVLVVRWNR